jgi:hypothetical protein
MGKYWKDTLVRLAGSLGAGQNPMAAFVPNKWIRFGLNTMGGDIPGIGGGLSDGMNFNGGGDFGLNGANSGMFKTPIEAPNAYLDLFGNPQNKLLQNLFGRKF